MDNPLFKKNSSVHLNPPSMGIVYERPSGVTVPGAAQDRLEQTGQAQTKFAGSIGPSAQVQFRTVLISSLPRLDAKTAQRLCTT